MFIIGEGTLRYGDVVNVIDAAKAAGVQKVGIVTEGMRKSLRPGHDRRLMPPDASTATHHKSRRTTTPIATRLSFISRDRTSRHRPSDPD